MPAAQGFNTAVSFVTNTNWQSYSGESALGYTVQAIGLTVQNFLSAAVGMAVVAALIRGLVRRQTDRLGNFWVDLTRISLRLLLPLSFLAALVLVVSGVIQNLNPPTDVATIAGGTQTLPGGLVASQEAIKELGTNGGGYFNANSAHPFENPTAFTNLFEIFLLLAIPFSLPRTFGTMVGNAKQGYAILAAMVVLWAGALVATIALENAHPGVALQAAGAATEGKEVRFGIPLSAMFAVSTTMTSTGAIDSTHSSYTGLGGGVLLLNMLLGEIAPGGTGSGLYGMLILAIITVFLAGLMVGRTPTYLGKRIGGTEMKYAASYLLVTPAVVLLGTAVALALPAGPGGSVEQRPARADRDHVRLRVGRQQQRIGVRRAVGEHRLLQHRPGRRDAHRPAAAHRAGPGPGRIPCPAGGSARRRRHPADLPAAVRGDAGRRRRSWSPP